MNLTTRARFVVLGVGIAILVIAVGIGVLVTRTHAPVPVADTLAFSPGSLAVRDTATGRLAVIDTDGTRRVSALECVRVYAVASRISCLGPSTDAPGQFTMTLLDTTLKPVTTLPLNGIPSRTRLSADGRLVGWTTFVSGDSYTSAALSTRTGILDTASTQLLPTLEDFTVDGHPAKTDANFWGVTFASDDDTFYATMATGGRLDLVSGSIGERSVTTVAPGVECPSLSPDGTRIAYKKRLADNTWQIWVYTLDGGTRTRLSETNTVDDQLAWHGNTELSYARPHPGGASDIWTVPADGSGASTLTATGADSPAWLN